jgi:hypothetical protein
MPPFIGGIAEVHGDAPSMHSQRGRHIEHLLTHSYQAQALAGLPLQQAAQAMQHLVGIEAQQLTHFIAGHDILNRRVATVRRGEMHIEGRFHLAHMGLGTAALAVQRHDLFRRPVELAEIGDQEEAMQQQIIGAFLNHQHHAARRWPGARLVGQVVAPFPRLVGTSAPWTQKIGHRQLLENRVTAQAAQVLDVTLFQSFQRVIVGETGIDVDPHPGPDALVEPAHQVRNPGVGVLGRACVTIAQQAADHIAGFGDGCDQRGIDPGTDMAVVGLAALVAEHLDRQAVDIQGEVLWTFTAVLSGQSPDRQSQ